MGFHEATRGTKSSVSTGSNSHRPINSTMDGGSQHRSIGELDGSSRHKARNGLDGGSSRHSNKSSSGRSSPNAEMSNVSGHGARRRASTGMSGGVPRTTKQVHLKSKIMVGGHLVKKSSKQDLTRSSSAGKNHKKKSAAILQGLQNAVSGIRPYIQSDSTEAENAMWLLDEAVDNLERHLATLAHNQSPQQPLQLPNRPLNIRYTMFVTDPTLEQSPFPDVTLSRGTYEANNPSEDRSTVVIGDDFIFAGVWDGHGGTSAAEFTQANIFSGFQQAYENGATVSQALISAFTKTDRDYYAHARKVNKPQVFFAGTCAIACHVDIKTGLVTCANLGDSRAVMGVYQKGKIQTVPLSIDHSAESLMEQTRLRKEHPDDAEVVVNIDDSGEDPDWRVKRLAAFTRSIGDLHLKEKNTSALFNSYVHPEQRILPRPGLKCKRTGITKPKYISTEPEIKEATVRNGFIIIACDGVWDEMSSEEAVNIVSWLFSKYDPEEYNIADLFIEENLKKAVHRIRHTYEEEENLTLKELKQRPKGKETDQSRSLLHDDITVVILQFGQGKGLQKQYGGTLFSMLQNNVSAQHTDACLDSQMFETQSMMSMSRTKTKREMATRNSILDWTAAIQEIQLNAERIETDNQIIDMMTAFDDLDANHLKILFNAVDVDGNGTLDREEITRLIRNVIMMDVQPGVVDLAFSEMDIDGSGDVDLEEFIQFFGK